jgi:hypothetical protein
MCKVDVIKIDALKRAIFDSMMSSPNMGLADMGDVYDEADRVVDEWVKKFFIEVVE